MSEVYNEIDRVKDLKIPSTPIPSSSIPGLSDSDVNVIVRVRPPLKNLHDVNFSGHRDEEWLTSEGRLLRSPSCIKVNNNQNLTLLGIYKPNNVTNSAPYMNRTNRPDKYYQFPRVYNDSSMQDDIFDECVPYIDAAFEGFNASILTYGPMVGGKTYTMLGTDENPGIIPRALSYAIDLTSSYKDKTPDVVLEMEMSLLELYNKTFRNLLVSSQIVREKLLEVENDHSQETYRIDDEILANLNSSSKIEIRESPLLGLFLNSTSKLRIPINNAEEALNILRSGLKLRTIQEESIRDSNRGHLICSIFFEMRIKMSEEQNSDNEFSEYKDDNFITSSSSSSSSNYNETLRLGKLHLIDLASGERVAETQRVGDALEETRHINRSLLAFGDVILSLHTQTQIVNKLNSIRRGEKATSKSESSLLSSLKSHHVPYYNTKLTHFLKDTFGSNGKSLLILNVPPESDFYFPTMHALDYAVKAKGIVSEAQLAGGVTSNLIHLNERYKVLILKLLSYPQIKHELSLINYIKKVIIDEEMNRTIFKIEDLDNLVLPHKIKSIDSSLNINEKYLHYLNALPAPIHWRLHLYQFEILDQPYFFFPMKPWIELSFVRFISNKEELNKDCDELSDITLKDDIQMEEVIFKKSTKKENYYCYAATYDKDIFELLVNNDQFNDGELYFSFKILCYNSFNNEIIELGRSKVGLRDSITSFEQQLMVTLPTYHLDPDGSIIQEGHIAFIASMMRPEDDEYVINLRKELEEELNLSEDGATLPPSLYSQLPHCPVDPLCLELNQWNSHEILIGKVGTVLTDSSFAFKLAIKIKNDQTKSNNKHQSEIDDQSDYSRDDNIYKHVYTSEWVFGKTRVRGRDLLANVTFSEPIQLHSKLTSKDVMNASINISLYMIECPLQSTLPSHLHPQLIVKQQHHHNQQEYQIILEKMNSKRILIGTSSHSLEMFSQSFVEGTRLDIMLPLLANPKSFKTNLTLLLTKPQNNKIVPGIGTNQFKYNFSIEKSLNWQFFNGGLPLNPIYLSPSSPPTSLPSLLTEKSWESGWLRITSIEADRLNTLELLGRHTRYQHLLDDSEYALNVHQDLELVFSYGNNYLSHTSVLTGQTDACLWNPANLIIRVTKQDIVSKKTPFIIAIFNRKIKGINSLIGASQISFSQLCGSLSLKGENNDSLSFNASPSSPIILRDLYGKPNGRIFLEAFFTEDNYDTWQNARVIRVHSSNNQSNGLYDVQYLDGSIEQFVSKDLLMIRTNDDESKKKSRILSIQTENNNSSNHEPLINKELEKIKNIEKFKPYAASSPKSSSNLNSNDTSGPLYPPNSRVEANFKFKGKWYPAKVYRVTYSTGNEKNTSFHKLPIQEQASPSSSKGVYLYELDYLSGEQEVGVTEDRIRCICHQHHSPLVHLKKSYHSSLSSPHSPSSSQKFFPTDNEQVLTPREEVILSSSKLKDDQQVFKKYSFSAMYNTNSSFANYLDPYVSNFYIGQKISVSPTGNGEYVLGIIVSSKLSSHLLSENIIYTGINDPIPSTLITYGIKLFNGSYINDISPTQIRDNDDEIKIKSTTPSDFSNGFPVGSIVEANYRSQGVWLEATVKRNRLNGSLYDLQYTSGHVETKVEALNVRTVQSNNNASSESNLIQQDYYVGDFVYVNLDQIGFYYPAQIVGAMFDVNSDNDSPYYYELQFEGGKRLPYVKKNILKKRFPTECEEKTDVYFDFFRPFFSINDKVLVKCKMKGVDKDIELFVSLRGDVFEQFKKLIESYFNVERQRDIILWLNKKIIEKKELAYKLINDDIAPLFSQLISIQDENKNELISSYDQSQWSSIQELFEETSTNYSSFQQELNLDNLAKLKEFLSIGAQTEKIAQDGLPAWGFDTSKSSGTGLSTSSSPLPTYPYDANIIVSRSGLGEGAAQDLNFSLDSLRNGFNSIISGISSVNLSSQIHEQTIEQGKKIIESLDEILQSGKILKDYYIHHGFTFLDDSNDSSSKTLDLPVPLGSNSLEIDTFYESTDKSENISSSDVFLTKNIDSMGNSKKNLSLSRTNSKNILLNRSNLSLLSSRTRQRFFEEEKTIENEEYTILLWPSSKSLESDDDEEGEENELILVGDNKIDLDLIISSNNEDIISILNKKLDLIKKENVTNESEEGSKFDSQFNSIKSLDEKRLRSINQKITLKKMLNNYLFKLENIHEDMKKIKNIFSCDYIINLFSLSLTELNQKYLILEKKISNFRNNYKNSQSFLQQGQEKFLIGEKNISQLIQRVGEDDFSITILSVIRHYTESWSLWKEGSFQLEESASPLLSFEKEVEEFSKSLSSISNLTSNFESYCKLLVDWSSNVENIFNNFVEEDELKTKIEDLNSSFELEKNILEVFNIRLSTLSTQGMTRNRRYSISNAAGSRLSANRRASFEALRGLSFDELGLDTYSIEEDILKSKNHRTNVVEDHSNEIIYYDNDEHLKAPIVPIISVGSNLNSNSNSINSTPISTPTSTRRKSRQCSFIVNTNSNSSHVNSTSNHEIILGIEKSIKDLDEQCQIQEEEIRNLKFKLKSELKDLELIEIRWNSHDNQAFKTNLSSPPVDTSIDAENNKKINQKFLNHLPASFNFPPTVYSIKELKDVDALGTSHHYLSQAINLQHYILSSYQRQLLQHYKKLVQLIGQKRDQFNQVVSLTIGEHQQLKQDIELELIYNKKKKILSNLMIDFYSLNEEIFEKESELSNLQESSGFSIEKYKSLKFCNNGLIINYEEAMARAEDYKNMAETTETDLEKTSIKRIELESSAIVISGSSQHYDYVNLIKAASGLDDEIRLAQIVINHLQQRKNCLNVSHGILLRLCKDTKLKVLNEPWAYLSDLRNQYEGFKSNFFSEPTESSQFPVEANVHSLEILKKKLNDISSRLTNYQFNLESLLNDRKFTAKYYMSKDWFEQKKLLEIRKAEIEYLSKFKLESLDDNNNLSFPSDHLLRVFNKELIAALYCTQYKDDKHEKLSMLPFIRLKRYDELLGHVTSVFNSTSDTLQNAVKLYDYCSSSTNPSDDLIEETHNAIQDAIKSCNDFINSFPKPYQPHMNDLYNKIKADLFNHDNPSLGFMSYIDSTLIYFEKMFDNIELESEKYGSLIPVSNLGFGFLPTISSLKDNNNSLCPIDHPNTYAYYDLLQSSFNKSSNLANSIQVNTEYNYISSSKVFNELVRNGSLSETSLNFDEHYNSPEMDFDVSKIFKSSSDILNLVQKSKETFPELLKTHSSTYMPLPIENKQKRDPIDLSKYLEAIQRCTALEVSLSSTCESILNNFKDKKNELNEEEALLSPSYIQDSDLEPTLFILNEAHQINFVRKVSIEQKNCKFSEKTSSQFISSN